MKSPSQFICGKCGNPVGLWFYGWKHQTGWKSKPTCGQKPAPIKRINDR